MEQKKNNGKAGGPTDLARLRGCNLQGDPNAAMPGDRPEAFSKTLSEADFHRRYGGDFKDCIQSVTYDDGTQDYGKLLPGHRPAEGHHVDADGFVVEDAAR